MISANRACARLQSRMSQTILHRLCTLVALALLLTACQSKTDENTDHNVTRSLPILTHASGNSGPVEPSVQAVVEYPLDQNRAAAIPGGVNLKALIDAAGDEPALFIIWSLGEKPTGGYDIRIRDVTLSNGTLVVEADVTEPGPDEMVIQALTYPYAAVAIRPVEYDTVEWQTQRPN